jgi:cellulose synthase/poly-beta-1,6-N-acetylglucosamine synthase-like glycosyltransferase
VTAAQQSPDRQSGLTVATRIVTLIPAHNEESSIADTIESVLGQTRVPDEIMVICDNCTDQTAEIAATYAGVTVFHTRDNAGRKAGALNQALAEVMPTLDDHDLVMCMDADTSLHPQMLENAERHFRTTEHLGAVSSNHLIHRLGNVIELLQAMEYERDRRFIGRRKGKFGCMTGMAAVYRVEALRDVESAYGGVYDPSNWTEDWKLTIALKHLRWDMVRPQDCLASTVPVSDVKGLFLQRERWARGYLQTLRQFGFTRYTAIPWLKQFGLVWSVLARFLLFGLLYATRHDLLAWWMLPVFMIFMADSINTVRKVGRKAILAAICFPLEIYYAWLITAAIASGYFKCLTGVGSGDTWQRVRR